MSIFEIEAESRSDMGKGASRRLRRDGKIPAIVYGGDAEPEPIALLHSEVLKRLNHEAFYSHILTVNVDGQAHKAVLRDIQRHPAKPIVMHMDFQRISENESIRVHVPLRFTGENVAPGVKAGGMVSHEMIEVELDVLPRHIPEYIEVDVSGLNVGDTLKLSDLSLPESGSLVELVRGEDHDLPVVSIHMHRGAAEAGEGEEAEGGEGGPEV
jgi:large subunit ribosomal protein L25